jgi:hypothetical protein
MKGIFGSTNKQKVCLPVKGFPGGGGNAQKSPYFEAIKNLQVEIFRKMSSWRLPEQRRGILK